MDEGDRHNVQVDELIYNDDGELSSLFITIKIVEVGREGANEPGHDPNPVIAAIGDELKILAAIAKVGGRFEKSESGLIASYAKIRAGELGVAFSGDNVTQAMNWLKRHIPDNFEVAQLIGRIERLSAIAALDEVCILVAEIDGKITSEEAKVVADLRNLLTHRRSIGFS
jgi:hypothetical protein